MTACINCNKELTLDEIGLHKKLVNRGSTKFMCLPCLAKHFEVSEKALYEKIEQYKKIGCKLFS